MPRSRPLIDVRDLDVAYGGSHALRGVSVEIRQSEIVAVLGANGAGKSTLLNAISGFVKPSHGDIEFLGESILGVSPARIVQRGLSQVPEGRHLFAELSVVDNLKLGAYSSYFPDWNLVSGLRALRRDRTGMRERLDQVFARFPRLRERRGQLAGSMSGGEQQMLAVGRALMSKPRILLMDEPSMGLAPARVREILQLACDLREAGMTILLVEQNANQALKIADRAYILSDGAVTLHGLAPALAADPQVQRIYLGGGVAQQQRSAGDPLC